MLYRFLVVSYIASETGSYQVEKVDWQLTYQFSKRLIGMFGAMECAHPFLYNLPSITFKQGF